MYVLFNTFSGVMIKLGLKTWKGKRFSISSFPRQPLTCTWSHFLGHSSIGDGEKNNTRKQRNVYQTPTYQHTLNSFSSPCRSSSCRQTTIPITAMVQVQRCGLFVTFVTCRWLPMTQWPNVSSLELEWLFKFIIYSWHLYLRFATEDGKMWKIKKMMLQPV